MALRRILAAAAVVALGSAVLPTAGHATLYYFTESGTSNFGDLPAPGYGSVDVTTVGADLKFVLQLAAGVYWFVDTGNAETHHPVAFNLATGGLTISGTPSPGGPLPTPFLGVNAGGYSNPSFNGPFNYAINCPDNGANGCDNGGHQSSLTFYVLGGGGLQPLLTDGVFITADILNSNATGSDKTGTVGATLAPVPGPIVGAGLPGLILAALGMFGLSRRRRRA